ncbi:hypothetical protein [Halobacteriovorax sp. HLS]|uniref:hypothetical protein n=1 Tax=Halobacteriovorax sp. HLS TaxID=2234000 RepID=UPI000FDA36BD|nr:hypothetical protein [Halobacteriovorax sp. HLS]
MKKINIIRLILTAIILTATGSIVNSTFAKIEAPNYDFSLQKLEPFTPNNTLASIEKTLGKGELIEDAGDIKIIRFMITHARYNFPVYIQVKKNIVLDFYARFPTYFLHDLFHQSLINKFGKQTKYHRQENDAVYIWENVQGMRIIYSGACTVTCFPNYVSYMKISEKKGDYVPLLQKFSDQFIGKFPK